MNDIEELIGYQIERKTLPEDLGEGPEWKLPSKGKKKNFKKKSNNSGNKNSSTSKHVDSKGEPRRKLTRPAHVLERDKLKAEERRKERENKSKKD